MKTIIYGASDDLIEIEGAVCDEVDCYDEYKKIETSDGTIGRISFGDNGTWDIEVKVKGELFIELVKSVGDDNKHDKKYGENFPSYSDLLVLDEGVDWVKIGGKKFKK